MTGLLSDHDIEFYVRLVWSQFTVPEWQSFGISGLATFHDLGIAMESTDRDVWLYCQQHNFLLVTANRNLDDDDSLEAVVRELNRLDALPVLTIARPRWIMNQSYRESCAYRIADIAIDLEKYRGTGRQFVP